MQESLFTKYLEVSKKAPKHEKAASVNEIIKLVGETKTYNYTYWLRKVGSAPFSVVMSILKDASNLESKYNKGGYITNKLKPYESRRTTRDGSRA